MDKKPIINQQVSGRDNIVQAGDNLIGIIVSGLPEVLVALLIASVVAQCGGYAYAALSNPDHILFVLLFPGICYPFVFAPFAFFSFFIGIVAKNKKIVFLSLLSGIISVSIVLLVNLVPASTLMKIVQSLQSS